MLDPPGCPGIHTTASKEQKAVFKAQVRQNEYTVKDQ